MNPFANRPKTITPERAKAKPTGKMYQSLDDMVALAALADEQVERADVCMKRADNLRESAAYLQDELEQRQKAMIEAGTERITNVAAGRMESPKMDALPPHDRKEIAKELIETLEADLAQPRSGAQHKKDTEPMEYSELIQAGVEEGILSDADAVQADVTVGEPVGDSTITSPGDTIDTDLRKGVAALDRARVADTRAADLRVTAKYSFIAAKTAWMELPQSDETWAQRCARVIPNTSQRTVDALIAGKPVNEDMDDGYEERLKAMAAEYGLPYLTPEERKANYERLKEAAAKRRQEQAKASAEARWKPVDADRDPSCEEHGDKPTKAEADQARRDEAETIRVANGGKPAQSRKSTERAALERDLVALMGDMDDDTLRGVLGFASRAVQTKKAA